MPEDMEKYLSFYGLHFNKKLFEFAVSMMKKVDKIAGRTEKVSPVKMENLQVILSRYGVEVEPTDVYDALYLATMVKADFWGSSIEDEEHMARYIKDVICDPDGYEGIVLCRFIADCNAKGIGIFWDMML
jgi:hypothetical protein